jgi:hypothetical protein
MNILAESTVALWFVMMMKKWDLNGLEVAVTPFQIFSRDTLNTHAVLNLRLVKDYS